MAHPADETPTTTTTTVTTVTTSALAAPLPGPPAPQAARPDSPPVAVAEQFPFALPAEPRATEPRSPAAPLPAKRAWSSVRLSAVVWATTAALLAASFALGVGFVAGARNPLLAPVKITAGPAMTANSAQRVYAAAKDAVVTISTNVGTLGAGFFYRPDRIVTNYHVVSGATTTTKTAAGPRVQVQVRLADGRIRTATVLGTDARLDIAVLSVPAGLNVRPLAFSDAFKVTPGADAYVVGAPFGLATTISTGVVSGLDLASSFATDAVQSALLSTDAAVNPGNSGGPLLDGAGAVLGVVTLRPDTVSGRPTQGLAFALPSNVVVAALAKIEKYGTNSHPQLGIYVTMPTPDDKPGPGLVVGNPTGPGSAALAAGLRAGDRLLSVDKVAVTTFTDLLAQIVTHRAGDVVTVGLTRAGQARTVDVKLAEAPAS